MTEVREYSFADWPLEGPMTVLHLVKHFGRHGGRWLGEWMRSRHIAETDRVSFEMRCLVDIVYLAGCYDQLNLPVLASVETACRRIQAIVEAYSAGSAGTPDCGPGQLDVVRRKWNCTRRGRRFVKVVDLWFQLRMQPQEQLQMEPFPLGVNPSRSPRKGRRRAWRPQLSNDLFSWGFLRPGSPLAAERWKGRSLSTFKRS